MQLIVAWLMVVALVASAVAVVSGVAAGAAQWYGELVADARELIDSTTTTTTTTTTAAPVPAESAQPSGQARPNPFFTWLMLGLSVAWVAVVALARLVPSKLPGQVVDAGSALQAAELYVRLGQTRPAAAGGLSYAIDDLVDSGLYGRIDVVAYSFGAIVAIDSFFPAGSEPLGALADVDSLISIGVPLDFVRAINPSYFEARQLVDTAPSNWINVYSASDLLGSNFREDREAAEATQGINGAARTPDPNIPYESGPEPTWYNWLSMPGFSAHAQYWGGDEEDGLNALGHVVARYAGTPLLPPPQAPANSP